MVVSHSRALAEAAADLAREMLHGSDVLLEVAAGLDDGVFGTDATAIATALAAADRGDGVVVLMDLGSAVLSAELALELLDDDAARDRVLLCPAPLVEGLVVAAVAAGAGAPREQVAAEALAGLAGKQAHLAPPGAAHDAGPSPAGAQTEGHRTAVLVVRGAHGLHARPAARLVQLVAGLDSRVELRNASTGSAWVPAASLSAVATLGALPGHEVQVRAYGPGAQAALDAVLALGAGDDDGPPVPATAAGPAAPTPPATGAVPASPGIAIGPAWVLRSARPQVAGEPAGDPAQEWQRLTTARDGVREQVRRSRELTAAQVGEQEAAVFDAHLLLLDDPTLLDDARSAIGAGLAAAPAWAAAADRAEALLAALTDPYLRARAADVAAVGDQVLRLLLGHPDEDDLAGAQGVLVAAELTPAQAAALSVERVAGVVLASGSPTAHSAILARARGVPTVVAAGPAVLDVAPGTLVALDGATGELVLDPAPEVLARFRDRAAGQGEAARAAGRLAGTPALCRDGTRVLVGANVGSELDARLALDRGADLAGLVRTEFLFLDRDEAPDVEEQVAVYRGIAQAMDGRRITLRTLDVGGDKALRYLPGPPEDNPFLGVRGLRLSLARPGLLADQLEAVLRVAQDTPVSLMFPMVSTVAELAQAREVLDAVVTRSGRPRPADLQVGIMVEVPAAALKTAAFAPYVDFFSIGTNDLTQYALAADRGNAAVAGLGDPYDPGVLALVAAVCANAGAALVAVCGELAADGRAAALLVGLGVRELSVAAPAVPLVKQAVREVDPAAAAATAARALAADGPATVRALLADGPGTG